MDKRARYTFVEEVEAEWSMKEVFLVCLSEAICSYSDGDEKVFGAEMAMTRSEGGFPFWKG